MQEKRKISNSIVLIGSVIFALIIFILLAFFVRKYDILNLDSWVFNHFVFRQEIVSQIIKILTYLGSFWGLLVLSLIVLTVFSRKEIGLTCLVALFVSGAVNYFIKLLFARDRPLGINLIDEVGYSFPSGHAMMSIAVLGVLIYFVFKFLSSRKKKVLLTILFSIIVVFIGYTRIYLGVHYFSDVLAGWCLGYLLIVFIFVIKNWQMKRKKRKENMENFDL